VRLPDQVREQFRRYGRDGGRKRAANLSPDARTSVARRAASVRWIRKRFGGSTFAELGLPGGEIVDAGLAGLAAGAITRESLLVSLAAPRLRREGVPLGPGHDEPEARLYDLLERDAGDQAHAEYGAYLRRLVSFADACRAARLARERRAP
jgi:hypothetical protein